MVHAGMLLQERYRLVALVGQGAVGDVWRAQDEQTNALNRPIAIKLLAAQAEEERSLHYAHILRHEADTLAKLDVPRIPKVYEFAEHATPPFLVQEYVQGASLDVWIHERRLFFVKLTERLHLLEGLAETLDALHNAGYTHRDVKPPNIVIKDEGFVPYLTDFSICAETERLDHSTNEVGTPLYAPPYDNCPQSVWDDYAFALVAYEVLFGRHALWYPSDESLTVYALRRVFRERLLSDKWHLPLSLFRSELPHDVWGAEMAQVQALMMQALKPRSVPLISLKAWVTDLKNALLSPANADYVDYPAPPQIVAHIPSAPDYTAHSVQQSPLRTRLPGDSPWARVAAWLLRRRRV